MRPLDPEDSGASIPGETAAPARQPVVGRWLTGASLLALAALKIAYLLCLDVNSDEPQHLHVLWGWTTGQLPYRDLFDNHAPVFQMLWSPVLALLGERADIVLWMRASVLPLYAASLWLTWRIARALWAAEVAVAAVAMTAACEPFFIVSTQFRPDDLWAPLWLATVWLCIGGRLDARRGAAAGLLAGATLAVSLKTAPLLLTAGFAAVLLVLALMRAGRMPRPFPWPFLLVFAAALPLVPGCLAIFFAANGAGAAMRYALFEHNIVGDLGRWEHGDLRFVLTPLTLPLVLAAAWVGRPRGGDQSLWARRTFVLLAASGYLVSLYGYWPLFTHQDLLPAVPFVGMAAAALLLRAGAPGERSLRWRRAAIAAIVFGEIALILHSHPFAAERYLDFEHRLATVLSLTRPQDHVMDAKGDSIFRPRPIYWVLESITLARMRDGSIEDDIAGRLADSSTPVVISARLPDADQRFVDANYLAAGNDVRVGGQHLGAARAGHALPFNVAVPLQYAVVSPAGLAPATVDGKICTPSCWIGAGPHLLLAEHDGDLAIVWAPAVVRGLNPVRLFDHP